MKNTTKFLITGILLNATKKDGLTYWRPTPRMDLPIAPDPTPISALAQLLKFDEQWNALEITGSCDTTWASDRIERRLIDGRYCYDISRSGILLSNKTRCRQGSAILKMDIRINWYNYGKTNSNFS